MLSEAAFSRTISIAGLIERVVAESADSLDAALYRLNNIRLMAALAKQGDQGVRIRLILDRGKYESDSDTRSGLANHRLPFRLLGGRLGRGSKMHHKFAVLDSRIVLTGSYNWTTESDAENLENLLILREPAQVQQYQEEFEALWNEAEKNA
ncbi:MAG: phospholipase D-like domain-containing protein [Terriglobia bacterium]